MLLVVVALRLHIDLMCIVAPAAAAAVELPIAVVLDVVAVTAVVEYSIDIERAFLHNHSKLADVAAVAAFLVVASMMTVKNRDNWVLDYY
jgi:hypothetical protein